MKRDWRPCEAGNFIKENITLLAWRFRLRFLADWFGVQLTSLSVDLQTKGINYRKERVAMLNRYISGNKERLSIDELAYNCDLTPSMVRKYIKDIKDEKNGCK